ncbi:uncharacterized protein cubi_03490 [Cryptosporidium ubiquitum]|uniref:Uncharacterized protein n=1 Tax=Cryptosporidium ubiquitum TaxID=857276 RepID=A0A1J4MKZ2_9CRYT|nr:uncharacterized protein cubi_03490 [Cryptosporidium ubiquitum]OII73692.1 hypothetical protein cubi_03490 [Cryptosporidium ubiquitum]
MDSAEILFCLLDSLDNCDLVTEASVYSTVVDFAKSTTTSSNCVGLVSNAITSFLQVSHTSVNHQLSLLRLLSLIISSYAISGDAVLSNGEGDMEGIGIINATNFSINNDISTEDIEFFEGLTKFVLNEYIFLKSNDPRRVALLQVLVSLVFLIPDKLVEILLFVAEESRTNYSSGGISSVLVAISAISKIFPELVCRKGHDIIVELLSLLHKAASGDSGSKSTSANFISKVELVRCLADVADALRNSSIERTAFAGLIGTAFDALLNDWVPAIQKDKEVFFLSFPTLETLGHLAQVIDDEQLKQHAPKLLSVYLQILNSLLSKKNKYFPSFVSVFSEPLREDNKCKDLLQSNIYTVRWRQYHAVATSALTPLLNSKSETIAISLHYSILSGFKLFLDRCHSIFSNVFQSQDTTSSLLSVLTQYCAIFHRLYAPALLPGHTAYTDTSNDAMAIEKELFELKNGLKYFCWDIEAVKEIITTHHELILCWKSLIKQDNTREAVIKFLFENIDIKSANRLSTMFILSNIIEDIPFEKVHKLGNVEITVTENSDSPLGCLMFRLARTTLEQGLDYSIAFILCRIICELSQHGFLHIGATSEHSFNAELENGTDSKTENAINESTRESIQFSNNNGNKDIWVSPSPSSAEMLTYFLRLLAVPEQKAKNEHLRHLQRQKADYLKAIQGSESTKIPVIYPPSLWDLRCNAQFILSEELTTLVPDLLWPLLIDAVNHLKLGSAMPTVCESLSKSCQNLYQKTTPEVFFNAFQFQSTKYLTLSDPFKIFIWLCMYAHDPHIYNGVLAYWSLQCLQWISPMVVSTPSCIWACIPSQRLQSLIEIADTIISPVKIKESQNFTSVSKSSNSLLDNNVVSNLSSKIDIDCWFPLVDECISYILSGISGGVVSSSPLNQIERQDLVVKKTDSSSGEFEKEPVNGIKSSDIVSDALTNLLLALFSACKDIRSDKVQKSSETPTELHRAGMYSILGLLLREISSQEFYDSDQQERKNLNFLRGIFISNILDGLITPDINSIDSNGSNAASVSGASLAGLQGRNGGELNKDLLSQNEIQIVKDLSKRFSDLQHFFHAIGINSTVLQRSCGRSIGYASSHKNHFIHISEYLLDLIKSDAANKRSGAFSFFGKSLAVVQAEQLRSTLIVSFGHSIGEVPVSLFNSATETVRKILQVLETAIKEEKELQLQCSTLKAIQIAFQALSSSESNPELTLSSRINSVLSRFHSGEGNVKLKKDVYGFDRGDISLELFSSFRDRIFPYLLTIIVFSASIELPPAPLNSMLLLKAASGMPYSTSSSISSQRIHTDPSGSYIRSMVRYRDISIGSFESLEYSHEDLGTISTTINDYDTTAKDISSSAKVGRCSNSYSESEDAKFGPFNLTLSVLSVLSENPYMISDSVNGNFLEAFCTTLDISPNLGSVISANPALRGVISNLSYAKNKNGSGLNGMNGYFGDTSSIEISPSGVKRTMLKGHFEGNKVVSDTFVQSSSFSGGSSTEMNGFTPVDSKITSNTSLAQTTSGTSNTFSSSVGTLNQTKNPSNINLSTQSCNSNTGNVNIGSANTTSSANTSNSNTSSVNTTGNSTTIGTAGGLISSSGSSTNNNNKPGTGNTNNSPNSVVFNKLLLDALDASISLISFPSPLLPQHIPLVVSSCLTILVTVSSRIQFRRLTEEDFSIFYTRNIEKFNLPSPSLNIIDGGYRLEEMMSIIEDSSLPTSNSEVSVFKILDSLDRLYLSIYKSHMPSWAGLTHLLEGLLGLAATSTSSVLRCICIQVVYCLLCEAPLVEIFQQSQIIQRPENNDSNLMNSKNYEGVPPKGTWVSWMHCIALVLGRTCDSCLFVRLIAFECIKECMKRCIWTQKIDLSQIMAIDFGTDDSLKYSGNRVPWISLSGNFEVECRSDQNEIIGVIPKEQEKILSDIQSLILPPTYLNLLCNLANCIPAYCLRPLCQHILPSFHDTDKITAHSGVETVRVLFSINKNILENESFACKIVSSLFEEISAIKDLELQHFVYLLIRNVVSFRFQAAISEIFRKCIQPQKYINHIVTGDSFSGDFIENIVVNNCGGQNSEWTAVDIPSDNGKITKNNAQGSVNSKLGIGLKNMINIIFVVDPIYSKAISYIGKDKSLLLESFRYLTDVLNNTEQNYLDIVEMNERLCSKICSSSNINFSSMASSNQATINTAISPTHNSVANLIGTGIVVGGTLSMGITANVAGPSAGSFSLVNKSLMFPFSTFSILPSEHINIRSSTLALDILLQTNDSAIKILAKKHFPELISTILLRCCSTLGYINMGALESSNALRSLFLALHDSDTILTFFDANQLKLSLIKPNEFDYAVMKLLCYLFINNPNFTTSIISFVRPFLRRVNSIYSMSALILLAPTPLGIYYKEYIKYPKVCEKVYGELRTEANISSEKDGLENVYSLEFLDSILSIIKTSNNPYSKKSGLIFFQWYFWYCLESRKYPSGEFLLKFLNVCFTNVIGSSLIRTGVNNNTREVLNPKGFRLEEKNEQECNEDRGELNGSRDFDASGEYKSRNGTDDEYNVQFRSKIKQVINEYKEENSEESIHEDTDEDVAVSNSFTDLSEGEISSEINSEEELKGRKANLNRSDVVEVPIKIKNRLVATEYLKECLVCLRYLVCLISRISTGLSLQFVPEHPTIYLNFNEDKKVSACLEKNSLYSEFVELLFLSQGETHGGQLQVESFQTAIFESEDLCKALVGENRISDIFIDFITNSDMDLNITYQKMYLLLDILILIRQNWKERRPNFEEIEPLRSSIKKLLIPLLVRLEGPTLELSRSVWRAVQLILSIILDENEWLKVLNEIHRKMILDDLMVQNSSSLSFMGYRNSIGSPISTNMSPTSINRIRTSKNISRMNAEKPSSNDSLRKIDTRQHADERSNEDNIQVINVDNFTLSYKNELSDGDKIYHYILPSKYRKISKTIVGDGVNNIMDVFHNGGRNSNFSSEVNPSNKFVQIKYSGECEVMNEYLLPIVNPIESNSYQPFLNCIIPFIIYSEILKDSSLRLKSEYQKSDLHFRKGSSKEINISGTEYSNKNEKDITTFGAKLSNSTLRELGRKIDDCHMYLNKCRYYFPREVWEITETAFSTIPKELDRIRKEAETQHLLFNRNIFGEMVNDNFDSNNGLGFLGQKSFLNKDIEIADLNSSTYFDSQSHSFSFSSYSSSSGMISIPSFARTALSRFNILWNTNRALGTIKEDFDGSGAVINHGDFTTDPELFKEKTDQITGISMKNKARQKLSNSDSFDRLNECEQSKEDTSLDERIDMNSSNEFIAEDVSENAIRDSNSPVYSKFIRKDNRLPETLEQQLNIKKMELISEYIKYPAIFKNLEKYREVNGDMRAVIEGIAAILASTFIKYISTELFQHLYTSEVFMFMAYKEISETDVILCKSSSLDSDFNSEEHLRREHTSKCLDNEELMAIIDKLLSLESLVAAICKQISTFVAHSQSPSRHRFAKALANLVYISFKP